MTSRNAADSSSQVEVVNQQLPPPRGATEPAHSRTGNKVYKSGPLFLASRGIGWTSWKKRWFILTRTSLVFFRSDPNAIPPKGEVNLTLGGIDLNSSGSVVVKEDKKLITVLFPDGRDGRDGRAFTLKAETLEDLREWKAALEDALANAPNTAQGMGQNGVLKNDQTNTTGVSSDQSKDRHPVKSLVIGRPILLALEDIDGTPSFLEKALRFVEEHGVKVEGILRQAAYVDDVECRIREYEQGKTEFAPDEDAHVIADCVKYILRELPSSPVPASCCNALLEAFRTERVMRVSAMRNAILETFPEPNRCLLQRILIMMQTVAAHKAQNRMSISAVAACMAPLLLRPLLAGDCELEHNFNVGGDSSVQLLQAAAAANHAQAIVITLLEEYDKLFGEGAVTPELYSDTEESGSESEELSEDYETSEDDCDDDVTEGSDAYIVDENNEQTSTGASSEAGGTEDDDIAKKNLTLESIDPPSEEEAEIQRLEATKAGLQHRIAEEAKGNQQLQESLLRRKNALHERRLSLEKDVARLKEQLQKEKELKTVLEAGLKLPQGAIPVSSSIDEKTKGQFEEIARAEEDVINLKQKVDDLGAQINQQREQNSRLRQDSPRPLQLSPNHHWKLKDKRKDGDSTAASNMLDKSTRNKHDTQLDRAESDKDKKKELPFSTQKHLPQNLPSDPLSDPGSAGFLATTSSTEVGIARPATTNSRKSGARGEGTNSTSSALSKLTNRLNFLKERRTQIANELQNLDKGRNTGQPSQSVDRGKGSEGQSSEKSRVDGSQPPLSPDDQTLPSPDRGRRLEGHSHLERGKSESFPAGERDKNRSIIPPRTYSR